MAESRPGGEHAGVDLLFFILFVKAAYIPFVKHPGGHKGACDTAYDLVLVRYQDGL